MGVKLRDELWGYELGISVTFLIISLIGMILCLVGVNELPVCTYGELDCYFFVKICGESYFNHNNNPYTCTWVAKQRSIEGSDGGSSEQLTLPVAAAVLSLLPGIGLVCSTIIANERTLLTLLEIGKVFLLFDTVILVVGCLTIHTLTFDCRWYSRWQHGNTDACQGGYIKYIGGTCVILVTQLILLMGIIAFGEMERKRVRSGGDDFAPGDISDLRTDAVPMNIRVTTQEKPLETFAGIEQKTQIP